MDTEWGSFDRSWPICKWDIPFEESTNIVSLTAEDRPSHIRAVPVINLRASINARLTAARILYSALFLHNLEDILVSGQKNSNKHIFTQTLETTGKLLSNLVQWLGRSCSQLLVILHANF